MRYLTLILFACAVLCARTEAQNIHSYHGSWAVSSQTDNTGTLISAVTPFTATGYGAETALAYQCNRRGQNFVTVIFSSLPTFKAADTSFRNGHRFVEIIVAWEANGVVNAFHTETAGIAESLNRITFINVAGMTQKIRRYDALGIVIGTPGGAITLNASLNGSSAAIRQARALCGMGQ